MYDDDEVEEFIFHLILLTFVYVLLLWITVGE